MSLTPKQIVRIQHPLWAEYQEDISAHWHVLADVGACAFEPGASDTMNKRVDELGHRFRKTFFPELL